MRRSLNNKGGNMTEPYITLGDLVEILSTDLTEAEIEAFLYEWGIA